MEEQVQPSDWTKVAEFPPTWELALLRDELQRQNIVHKLVNHPGSRQLWVRGDDVTRTVALLKQPGLLDQLQEHAGTHQPAGLGAQLRRHPVMVVCLLLSALGAALVHWHFELLHWFTFQDFNIVGRRVGFGTIEDALAEGQFWRLLTPIFLHFGIFHLAFNSLWIWEFGRRIEGFAGSLHLAVIVLLTGVGSNLGQYLWEGPSLFGGMSGVLYGLLGYLWIRHKVHPQPELALPPGIVGFLLAWLVICMTGIVDLLMGGRIANAAHASGLVLGMILGAGAGLIHRGRSGRGRSGYNG